LDEILIPGRDDPQDLVKRFLSHYDAPAYARRARNVQEAYDHLLARCRRQRDEWLFMVRMRLGQLRGLAGEWVALRPMLADDDQVRILHELEGILAPRLRAPVVTTSSARVLARTLEELRDSLERFNRRWQDFLPQVDLTRVNELRDGYNRYYLLEKECAFRSPRLARQGFRRLEPLSHDDLAAALPMLPVPLAAAYKKRSPPCCSTKKPTRPRPS
jgi:hypothetical protein